MVDIADETWSLKRQESQNVKHSARRRASPSDTDVRHDRPMSIFGDRSLWCPQRGASAPTKAGEGQAHVGRRGTWPRNLGATPFFQTQLKHRHPYLPERGRINAALDAAGVLCRRRGVCSEAPTLPTETRRAQCPGVQGAWPWSQTLDSAPGVKSAAMSAGSPRLCSD